MNNILISVLIPVYNGEKFLPQLINSLRNQTYKNFEAIFVDDLSTDKSADVILKIANNDKRFKYIKRATKGGNVGTGMDYGFPYLNGDYYFIMSQDDFIDDNMFEKGVEKIMETNADIVICDVCFYEEGKEIKNFSKYPLNNDYSQILSPKEAYLKAINSELGGFGFRKIDLAKKVKIEPIYFCSSDFYGMSQILIANKIAFVNSMFYYRVDNPEAITHKKNPYYFVEIFMQDVMLLELLFQNDFSIEEKNKRLKWTVKRTKKWYKYFFQNSYKWKDEQCQHYKKVLKECLDKLKTLCLMSKNYVNYLRIIKYEFLFENAIIKSAFNLKRKLTHKKGV